MITSLVNGSKQLGFQFNDEEWEIIEWVQANYGGVSFFEEQMSKLIASRRAQMVESEKEALHSEFRALSKSDKVEILANIRSRK